MALAGKGGEHMRGLQGLTTQQINVNAPYAQQLWRGLTTKSLADAPFERVKNL